MPGLRIYNRRGIGYPESRDNLVKFAEDNQASSNVLDLLGDF
ncbi:DUF2795 domain-containing protein [Methanosarcina spelaei]|nr:DUF2795 domain-containing protein [Methanosarcina spelaei]